MVTMSMPVVDALDLLQVPKMGEQATVVYWE
jgi:hypothetical protein